MRRLYAMIRNEFLREFSSPIQLVFFILLPLLFTAAVGAGLSGMMDVDEAAPQEAQFQLYVQAGDESPLVEAFLAALRGVNVDVKPVAALPEDAFGLEIPANFSTALQAGENVTVTLHILPDRADSTALEQAVRAAQGRVGGVVLVARLGLEQARSSAVVKTPAEESAFFADVLQQTLVDTQNPPAVGQVRWPEGVTISDDYNLASSAEQASAGQLVTWVQITLLGAAEVLVDERLRGTLRRLLTMPTARGMILAGKFAARLAQGLLQIAILLLGGALLFGVNWGRDPLAVALVSLSFALAMVALGVLLATFVKSRGQASSLVVGLSMAMAALGGAWYPMEITPQLYQQVVKILPSTWAMRAYSDLVARGANIGDVLPYVGVLLGFAVVFGAIGAIRFQKYE